MAIWTTKCDCCGERFCFLAVFKYRNSRAPVLERESGASSQQPVGRGTLQFAHDFTASTGIPVHSVPTGAGIGWSDTSRTRLHRIQLPAATERSEATYFPEGTPGSEAGTQQQAINYCEKQETRLEGPWRYGEPLEEGGKGRGATCSRSKSALDEGSTDLQLWEEFFPTMMRYYKGWLSTRF